MSTRSARKVEAHLHAHLGVPQERFELGNSNPASAISTLTVDCFLEAKAPGRSVLATVGAYRHRMSDGRRIEALMMLNASTPDRAVLEGVRDLLASFVLIPESQRRSLRYGDVIRAPALLRAAGSGMHALVALPPMAFPPSFRCVPLIEGNVEWLWLVPLYKSEADLALRDGAGELVLRLAKSGIDLTDLGRRPPGPRRRKVAVSAPELRAVPA